MQCVWVIFYNKKSEKDSISWSDAVSEALCFGWIDSRKQTIDEFSYRQFFSQRKPNSTWSKINKEKVSELIESGEMQTAGYESIEIAKQNGSWTILDEVEALIVPLDLQEELAKYKNAIEYFDNLSNSKKKMLLHWVNFAKRPETRINRIKEIAYSANQKKMPDKYL